MNALKMLGLDKNSLNHIEEPKVDYKKELATKENSGHICKKCGSSNVKRLLIFGFVLICSHCNYKQALI